MSSSHEVQSMSHRIQTTSNNSQSAFIFVNRFISKKSHTQSATKFADALRLRFEDRHDESFQSLMMNSNNP